MFKIGLIFNAIQTQINLDCSQICI